jgi:hypothetical protein
MTHFGYTAMGEQAPAKQLVTDSVAAELAGFDFGSQRDFIAWTAAELLPALRDP